MQIPTEITFFECFEKDILNKKKTITIRDKSESHYQVNSKVITSTYEEGRIFTTLKILDVAPIIFDELNENHAQQENMTLAELKQVIRDIYPDTDELFIIEFEMVE